MNGDIFPFSRVPQNVQPSMTVAPNTYDQPSQVPSTSAWLSMCMMDYSDTTTESCFVEIS